MTARDPLTGRFTSTTLHEAAERLLTHAFEAGYSDGYEDARAANTPARVWFALAAVSFWLGAALVFAI